MIPRQQCNNWKGRTYLRKIQEIPWFWEEEYLGVSKNSGIIPKWMMKIVENPINMEDFGVPLFLETPISYNLKWWFFHPAMLKLLLFWRVIPATKNQTNQPWDSYLPCDFEDSGVPKRSSFRNGKYIRLIPGDPSSLPQYHRVGNTNP